MLAARVFRPHLESKACPYEWLRGPELPLVWIADRVPGSNKELPIANQGYAVMGQAQLPPLGQLTLAHADWRLKGTFFCATTRMTCGQW
jgi:hypothetical protein